MARSTTVQIRPTDGGHLVTIASPDVVGPNNYVRKLDMRRQDDAEVPREGWSLFVGNPSVLTDQHTIPTNEPKLGLWEIIRPNGERNLIAATKTKLYRFTYTTGTWTEIGSGFSVSTTWWQAVATDGNLVLNNGIDLPQLFRIEWNAVQPLYELREIGVASVGWITAWNGFLICSDVTEIASSYMATLMNGASPYGIVSAAQTNRIRYRELWSDYTQPTNFSPVITGTIQSASKNQVTLAYKPHHWAVGTKVAVIGAGINGGTLGGEEGFEDGVPITSIAGNVITLGEPADSGLTYPLTVQVTRWADTSTFSGYSDIQDDSSAIIATIPLKQVLVVYRETGIFTGRFTGNAEEPFVFTPTYRGADVPRHPRAIADIQGDSHVYPTKDRFAQFDGAGNPTYFKTLDRVRNLFFGNGLADNTGFAAHNEVTKEYWFQGSGNVVAYDYQWDEVSEVGESIQCAATVAKLDSNYAVTPSELWFVYVPASTHTLVKYGRTSAGSLGIYARGNISVTPVLKFGAFSGRDLLNDKALRDYSVIAEPTPGYHVPVSVSMYGADSVSLLPSGLLFTEAVAQTDVLPQIQTYYRNVLFQDQVTFTGTIRSFRFCGRTMSFIPVGTRGVTRNYNGSD